MISALKQPADYSKFFFAFVFERISYYGIRAIIFVILNAMVAMPSSSYLAKLIFAVFPFMFIVGGLVVDFFNSRNMLAWSSLTMFAGLLAVATATYVVSDNLLAVGLIVWILGEALFRPALLKHLSDLYPRETRFDFGSGFLILMLASSLGGFLAPIICGTLNQFYGAAVGVGAAAFAALIPFLILRKFEIWPGHSEKLNRNDFKKLLYVTLLFAIPAGAISNLLNHLGASSLSFSIAGIVVFFVVTLALASWWTASSLKGQPIKTNTKILLGLGVLLVSCLIATSAIFLKGDIKVWATSTAIVINSAVDLFITPVVFSFIARTRTAFKATLFAIWLSIENLPGLLIFPVTVFYKPDLQSSGAPLLLVISIVLVMLTYKWRNRIPEPREV